MANPSSRLTGQRALLQSSTVSALGDGVRFAALPLLAVALLDNPFQVTVLTAAGTAPWLLVALPAGVYVDRLDRQRVMIYADLLRCLVLTVAVTLLFTGHLTFWPLVALAFLLGVGEVLFDCAAQALLPGLVPGEHLERANGHLYATQTIGRDLIGQALGGMLFALNRCVPLLVDAVSFLCSALLLRRVPTAGRHSCPPHRSGHIAREIGECLRYLLRHRVLLELTAAATLVNTVYMGQLAVLILLVREELHLPAALYGVLLTIGALGGVAASTTASRLTEALGRRAILTGGLVILALSGLGIAATRNIYLVAGAYCLSVYAITCWTVIAVSLRQGMVPDRLRGRSTSVDRLFTWGTNPFGVLAFGAVSQLYGPRASFAAGSVCALAALAVTVSGVRSVPDRIGARWPPPREAPADRETRGHLARTADRPYRHGDGNP
ncbi:MFS transporter [Streptomyces sp. CT34]|uniref:MFS transporter n=1 Tax=Streptomyces sp. CT34 TaxID=1553907 RepID=UPI00068CA355|nr:MFS transporter [Streptomyces sp. CT34]